MSQLGKIIQMLQKDQRNMEVLKATVKQLLDLRMSNPALFKEYSADLESIMLKIFDSNYPLDRKIENIGYQLLIHKYLKKIEKEIKLKEISNDALLLYYLKHSLNTNLELEYYFKEVRKQLLCSYVENNSFTNNEKELSKAFIYQGYNNEFIWTESEMESHELLKIQKAIFKNEIDDSSILSFGMYRSFKNLLHLDKVREVLMNSDDVLYQNLFSNLVTEENLKSEIESIGTITDDTSAKVKDQYEQNPYPRWNFLKSTRIPIGSFLRRKESNFEWKSGIDDNQLEILVAGCGTGQQPITLAKANPNYKILAVDLSLSSLSYAKRKANELKIGNIEFLHADILNLGQLNRKFHHIECGGVIHHMENQDKAWAILNELLYDGGTMYLAVYSAIARMGISFFRNDIESRKINDDDVSMKSYRNELIENGMATKTGLRKLRDFNTTSMFRDLLFHVSETHYTLAMIEKYLTDFGLRFISFDAYPPILKKYKKLFPDDLKCTSFENWKSFEKHYAGTFCMFHFWCQKK